MDELGLPALTGMAAALVAFTVSVIDAFKVYVLRSWASKVPEVLWYLLAIGIPTGICVWLGLDWFSAVTGEAIPEGLEPYASAATGVVVGIGASGSYKAKEGLKAIKAEAMKAHGKAVPDLLTPPGEPGIPAPEPCPEPVPEASGPDMATELPLSAPADSPLASLGYAPRRRAPVSVPARAAPARFSLQGAIAVLALGAIAIHLALRFGPRAGDLAFAGFPLHDWPLLVALALGGLPLVAGLAGNLLRRELSSDLLAGISIVTSAVLGEYLAGTLVVLMLSGGQALESYAVRSASSVLAALARRMPQRAHRRADGGVEDVALDAVVPGDTLLVFPHEICPVDGTVLEGHGAMDESYLTGEPYLLSKIPGAAVPSGAVNGETALLIRADKKAIDSRYAKILDVMRESEQRRPRLRRLADQLGAWCTPIAVAIAGAVWAASGEPRRFLAVLVVATPCPLLIAIPVAIIGSISLAARRGIIVRDPAVPERIGTCRTALFDKTGTLTYGEPLLTEILPAPGFDGSELLVRVASLERYSRYPLAAPLLAAAAGRGLPLDEAEQMSERPGEGLRGVHREGSGLLPSANPCLRVIVRACLLSKSLTQTSLERHSILGKRKITVFDGAEFRRTYHASTCCRTELYSNHNRWINEFIGGKGRAL